MLQMPPLGWGHFLMEEQTRQTEPKRSFHCPTPVKHKSTRGDGSAQTRQLTALVVFLGRLLGFSLSLSTTCSFFSRGSCLKLLFTSFSARGDPSQHVLGFASPRLPPYPPHFPPRTPDTNRISRFFPLHRSSTQCSSVRGLGAHYLTTKCKLSHHLKSTTLEGSEEDVARMCTPFKDVLKTQPCKTRASHTPRQASSSDSD